MRRIVPRRLRAHPVFFAALAALMAAATAGAVVVASGIGRWRMAGAELAQLRIEHLTPQTRPEMIAAAEVALVAAQERLAGARAAWPATEVPGVEADRLAAYADLVGYVERCRAAAEAAGVSLEPGEHFGFARHAQEAPAAEEVVEVLVQKRVLERVLGRLFAAGPERLRGVWREAASGLAAERANAEWCRLEATRSVGVAQLATTRAVRVAFEADTACLRRFLNGLANEPGFVVREVAVAAREERRATEGGAGAESEVRRFGVTLEAVELATGGAVHLAAASPAVDGPWHAPSAERPGGPVVELFTPRETEAPAAKSGAVEAGAGIELLAVRVIPYQWRLVGHMHGEEGDAAVLEETGARRSVVLALGEYEPRSGVMLATLEVVRARHGGRGVRAVLTDPRERKPVVLTTTGETGAACVVATLRVRGRGEPLEVAEGATVRMAGEEFTVAAIRADPAEVEMTRAGTDAVLRLRGVR